MISLEVRIACANPRSVADNGSRDERVKAWSTENSDRYAFVRVVFKLLPPLLVALCVFAMLDSLLKRSV